MFIGRGSAKVGDGGAEEAFVRAKLSAVKDACEMVSCKVSSRTTVDQAETASGLVDAFVNRASVETTVEAVGVEILRQTADRKWVHVEIGIPRSDLRETYRHQIRTGLTAARTAFELGESLVDTSPRQAKRKYETCMVEVRELEEQLKVYLFLNDWQNDLNEELEQAVSSKDVESRLAAVAERAAQRPAELAVALAKPLLRTFPRGSTFAIYPIEFENTGYVSRFGHTLTTLLAAVIERETGGRRVDDLATADVVFRGRLLASDKGAYIVLSAKGTTASSSQIYVGETTCKSIGWESIRPLDLDKVLQDKAAMYAALKSDSRLHVALRTDRMTDGPVVYTYGDRPQLLLKADRACYVRLIYIFSDGTQVLLLDNYRISQEIANEWRRLPVNWEVCEPPGVEQMLVQATVDQPMPSLNVRRRNLPGGYYQDIIQGTVKDAVMLTRGGKMFRAEPILTEVPYQWTVFEE